MKRVFLGLGSNLGNREKNLKDAIEKIGENIGTVIQSSPVYETAPWGFESEKDFLNMVIHIHTEDSPRELMAKALSIESLLGRTRNTRGYSSRPIDIDILLYDDLVMNEKELIIPHPHMHERRFVLVPLCDLEPGLVHPVLKMSVSALLLNCTDHSSIRRHISRDV